MECNCFLMFATYCQEESRCVDGEEAIGYNHRIEKRVPVHCPPGTRYGLRSMARETGQPAPVQVTRTPVPACSQVRKDQKSSGYTIKRQTNSERRDDHSTSLKPSGQYKNSNVFVFPRTRRKYFRDARTRTAFRKRRILYGKYHIIIFWFHGWFISWIMIFCSEIGTYRARPWRFENRFGGGHNRGNRSTSRSKNRA